jgi:CRISPR system Cascade subunit CasA
MTPSFNLVDQPWIPCIANDGGRQLLCLEAALAGAHDIREIYDDSPLVTVTLHRLLLAILHHNFGPADASAWGELWQGGTGQFDANKLHVYFHDMKRYRRFDLFDADHPFYQSAAVPFSVVDPETKKEKSYAISIAKMATELAAGNNDTLFDHSVDDRPSSVTPAEAARLVLACQGYSMGGRITFEQKQDGSADSSPLVKGAVAVVRGENLFQTLMLNLCQYSDVESEPFSFDRNDDKPVWDRDGETAPRDRKLAGYLDLLTWQSRRIRLRPDVNQHGDLSVCTVVMMKGEQFLDGFVRHGNETMVAFTRNAKATEKQDPWPAVGFDEDRVLWRDSLALFESVEGKQQRPKTLTWLNQLVDEGRLARSAIYRLDLFGLSSDQAKVLLWRHERLPLPLAFLNTPRLLLIVREALAQCEAVRESLRQGVWQFAKVLLLRDESKQPGTEQGKDIRKLIDSLGADRLYWSALEVPFHQLLAKIAQSPTPDEDDLDGARDTALVEWCSELKRVARKVFDGTVKREDSSARSLKAAVFAERYFAGMLKKVLTA